MNLHQASSNMPPQTYTQAYVVPVGTRIEAWDKNSLRFVNHQGTRDVPVLLPAIASAIFELSENPFTLSSLTEKILTSSTGIETLHTASAIPAVLDFLTTNGIFHLCLVDSNNTLVAELKTKGYLPIKDVIRSLPKIEETPIVLNSLGVLRQELRDDVPGWVLDAAGATAALWFPQDFPVSMVRAWPKTLQSWAAAAGLASTDNSIRAKWWNPIDAIFHERIREARSHGPYGGTRPFEGKGPGARWDSAAIEEILELPEPRPLPSVSLEKAMYNRVSAHEFSGPCSLQELSDLFGHTVRCQRIFIDDAGGEVLSKTVPAGGSIHEVETWVAISEENSENSEIPAGLWHYNCLEHVLERVGDTSAGSVILSTTSRMSVGQPPPMALLHTARFARLMWKYESVAYGLILKHVGVIHEAIQLTATALNLATCALGGGMTSVFASVTGIDPLIEGVVGEMTLGQSVKHRGEGNT